MPAFLRMQAGKKNVSRETMDESTGKIRENRKSEYSGRKFWGRIFIFCPFIRCRKGGGGPERVNQEISQKGFFCIVKREKFWNVSRWMPLPFPGFYFYRKKYRKMFHVKQRRKVLTVSKNCRFGFPGKNFTGNRNNRNTVLEAGKVLILKRNFCERNIEKGKRTVR